LAVGERLPREMNAVETHHTFLLGEALFLFPVFAVFLGELGDFFHPQFIHVRGEIYSGLIYGLALRLHGESFGGKYWLGLILLSRPFIVEFRATSPNSWSGLNGHSTQPLS
jgi:hypothetical protein